jgi:hypothetical protein
MNTVNVLESHGGSATSGKLRFSVEVDGQLLRNSRGIGRRFATSFAAAIAGAKEVDRRRAQPQPAEPAR